MFSFSAQTSRVSQRLGALCQANPSAQILPDARLCCVGRAWRAGSAGRAWHRGDVSECFCEQATPSSSLCRSSRASYSRKSWRSKARRSRSRWKRLSLSCAWRDLSCISSISWTRSSRVSAGASARAGGCDGRPREATNTGHLTEAPLPMART